MSLNEEREASRRETLRAKTANVEAQIEENRKLHANKSAWAEREIEPDFRQGMSPAESYTATRKARREAEQAQIEDNRKRYASPAKGAG